MNPSTARQLVEGGFFPNVAKARKRINRLKTRFSYLVNLTGHDEKLHALSPQNRSQHAAEITELVLRFRRLPNVTAIRRDFHVDRYLADLELDFDDGTTAYGEHDRGTVGFGELLTRIKGYADCGRDVLWSMPSQTRIDGIISYARRHDYELPPSMWFGIYHKLLMNIAGPWTNADGQEINL